MSKKDKENLFTEPIVEETTDVVVEEETNEKSEDAKEEVTVSSSKWFVCVDFYDLQQQRVVTVGEEVEHNERREELGLIRQE
ncbi:MAG: hypothetical protein ACRCVU_14115 [Flavobacterium sp.]